jgi:autotransporter passenger strand-loop-strand repeat protein
VLVDGARVESAVIAAGGTAVVLSGAVASDVTVQSGGVLEVHDGAMASGLDAGGGSILDFMDVRGGASATLSGTEIDISSAGAMVAEVGLSSGAAADIGAGPLTLGSDGSGGSELIVPSLGNDTIHPGAGPEAIAALGSATVMAGGSLGGADQLTAGSGDTTIVGGETLFSPGTVTGGPDSFGGGGGWPVSEGGIAPAPFDPQPPVGDGASQSDPSPLGGAVTLHLTDGTMVTLNGFPHLTG